MITLQQITDIMVEAGYEVGTEFPFADLPSYDGKEIIGRNFIRGSNLFLSVSIAFNEWVFSAPGIAVFLDDLESSETGVRMLKDGKFIGLISTTALNGVNVGNTN